MKMKLVFSNQLVEIKHDVQKCDLFNCALPFISLKLVLIFHLSLNRPDSELQCPQHHPCKYMHIT